MTTPDGAEIGDSFDVGTYGRSFADVYDAWYPADDATDAAVDTVVSLAGPGGSVLELGVGTGRIAVPLAERGLRVTGVDASVAMLDLLAGKDPNGGINRVLADIGNPEGSDTSDRAMFGPWPSGPFDVVLAACNLLCNLTDAERQSACIRGAAERLVPGGHLVVEAFEPAPLVAGPHLAASEVRGDAVVLIATNTDPTTGVVVGNHIELRNGEPVRLRPWSIRAVAPAEIDRWATDAGLELVDRTSGWIPADGEGEGASTSGLVTIYQRPTAPGC